MLTTQLNNFIENGELCDNVFLRVKEFMKNVVKNHCPVVILLNFDILENPGYKIGSPSDIMKTPEASSAVNGGDGNGVTMGNPVRANDNFVKPEQSSNPYGNQGNSNNNPYGGGMGGSSAPIMRTATPSSGKLITPISQLNMYQNRWTIKARVTSKSDIKQWSNSKGEGSLFSVELLDSTSDIKCTFFREAVDKFHPMLEVDQVYTFSGGRLKAANLQYNNCKSSFEITFDQNSEICKEDDTGEIMQQSYSFIPIASLENTEAGKAVDIVGVVKSVGEPAELTSKKTQKQLTKCDIVIGDDSGADVSVAIWGERAKRAPMEFGGNPIVALRRAKVSDYGGKTLSASDNGINVNPRVPELQRMQMWWNSGGSSAGAVKSLSSGGGSGGANRFPKFEERKTVTAIKNENLGYTNPDKPDWLSFKGTLSFIKSDREGGAWYSACPNENEPCKQRVKVTQSSDGNFYCERCSGSFENCLYRYIFSATLSDDTGSTWVSFFNDQALPLLGGTEANELHEMLNGEQGQDAYDGAFAKATFTDWIFTCKVKQELNNGEMRVKTSVHSLHPMDYAQEGRSLLNSILAM